MKSKKTENKRQKTELRANSGQALLELALFGSIILMLLGILISYGLRYSFQQQADMHAFRKAVEVADRYGGENYPQSGSYPRGSSTYTLVKDRHIPSIETPFGVGGVQPFMSSASVTKDTNADMTADNYDGLPKITIEFQGKENGHLVTQERELALAGIRKEYVWLFTDDDKNRQGRVRNNVRAKYNLIYGSVSGWPDWQDPPVNDGWITIIDNLEGEVVDYNAAIKQARLIVDRDFFLEQCNIAQPPGSEVDCGNAAWEGFIAVDMWYLWGVKRNGVPYDLTLPTGDDPNGGNPTGGWRNRGVDDFNDTWEFPMIESLFYLPLAGGDIKKVQSMGPQSDYTQATTTDLKMQKQESNTGITTTDNLNWSTVTNRILFYHDHLIKTPPGDPNSGMAIKPTGPLNLQTETLTTPRSEQETTTWQTPQ